MRILYLCSLCALASILATVGCTPTTTAPGGGGGADKLKEAMLGKWEGKEGDTKVTYTFDKDGKFTFSADKVKYSGAWKAVDDKDVELDYKLSDDELKAAKELYTALPEKVRAEKKEPQKENKIKVAAEVKKDELTLNHVTLTKVK